MSRPAPSPTRRLIDRYPAGSHRQVWVLSYPAILTMISQTVMWTIDSAMVGHVGKVELAAVGLGGMFVFTVYSFFIGLTSAVNTFVSQSYGAGDERRCGVHLWNGLYLALAGSVVLLVIRAYVPEVMAFARPSPDVEPLAVSYTGIRMLSATFFLVHYTYAHFYRGIGDTMTPLKILAVAHAVNIAGDYALIFGAGPFPEMGVEGAAWATTLSNVVAAGLFIARSQAGEMRGAYGAHRPTAPSRADMERMLRVGMPIALHFLLDIGSFLVFTVYIGRMGTEQLAATQIAIQILALSFMPMQGFGVAATTLMGQYIGAGLPENARRAAGTTLRMGMYFAAFIALLCLTVPGALVRIFNDDPAVVAMGTRLLYLAALFQVFDGVQFICSGALRGAGDTRIPMLIIMGGTWLVFLPLAYVLGTVLDLGVTGAWTAATLYIAVVGSLMFLRLKREGWRGATA